MIIFKVEIFYKKGENMNKLKAIVSVLLVASISSICIASVGAENSEIIVPKSEIVTAEEAVKAVVSDEIKPFNIKSTGDERQIGIFTAPENMKLPFDKGILLSTGDVTKIFEGKHISQNLGGSGNSELQNIYQSEGYNNSTYDAATLSFDIIPTNSELSFDFFFASTEYNQLARYNDVFALWIVDSETGEKFNVAQTPFSKIVNVQNTVTRDVNNNVTYTIDSKYYNYINNYYENGYGFSFLGYTTKFTADGTDLVNKNGNKVVAKDKPVTIEFAITDCADAIYDSAIFIRCDSIEFKALEKKIFTINYDTNKLSDDVCESVITGTDGTIEKLPTITSNDPNYTFDGWYTAPTGGEKVSENTIFEEDTTLYAHWKSSQYTITFETEYGTPVDSIVYSFEKPVLIPSVEINNDTITFEYWTVVDGNGSWEKDSIVKADTSTIDAYGDVTLKAVFSKVPVETLPVPPAPTVEPTTETQETTVEVQETTVPATETTTTVSTDATSTTSERVAETQNTTAPVKSNDTSTVKTGTVFPTLIILVALSSCTVLLVFIRRKTGDIK